MTIKFTKQGLQDAIDKIVKYCKTEGKYFLVVEKAKEKRTLPQNRYYWGVVVKVISDYTGYTSDEVHQVLGHRFLSYESNGHKFVRSTTSMNTAEFAGYIDQVRQYASEEIGCYVPEANEVTQEMWLTLAQKYER